LQVGTYPIAQPQHGGQRRVAALRRAYRAAGLQAEYVAVYNPFSYLPKTAAPHDIPVGPVTLGRIAGSPWLEDVFAGEALLYDAPCRENFLSLWRRLRPDLVALEGPFLWASLRQMIADGLIDRPALVYSSQNVEAAMKADIYDCVLPPGQRQPALAKVAEVEADLTRNADVLVAVHRDDADRLQHAAVRPCVLMRNGGEFKRVTPAARRTWARKFRGEPPRRRAFFVGSAHPPNLEGLVRMLGPSLGHLPPDCQILVAGRVCLLLQESDFWTGPLGGVNASRLRLLGCLPDDDLGAVLGLSDLVLLPITSGGGSNLKTVEALLSGKPVVATRYAFRAYEDFAAGPGVTLADDPPAFRRAVAQRLHAPDPPPRPPGWERRLCGLTWEDLGRAYVPELLACLAA
jgi:glycosyltransferase involved in cell wall biosynthesis